MTTTNDVTGDLIKSKVGTGFNKFAENFDLIDSGIICNQPETMFPVTIQIPKAAHKAFTELAKDSGTTLEKLLQKQVLHSFNQ